MISIFIITAGFSGLFAFEISDFKVIVQENGDHILIKKDPSEVFIRLQKPGANFKLHRVFEKKGYTDLVFVEYLSATVGTSKIINLYRAAIFDKKANTFIGDIPSKKQMKDKDLPYKWKYTDSKIIVFDKNKVVQKVILK